MRFDSGQVGTMLLACIAGFFSTKVQRRYIDASAAAILKVSFNVQDGREKKARWGRGGGWEGGTEESPFSSSHHPPRACHFSIITIPAGASTSTEERVQKK